MNLYKSCSIFLLFLLIFSAIDVSAENLSDSLVTYESEDSIVVVANRYKASLKSIAYSYQIVNREQIQALGNHSALEMVDINFPSSFIMEKKVMGFGVGTDGSGQVYMRGLGGQPNTGVLVLLNGHPDFMGIFGHPLPDVYGTDDIQQVEILAGPASTVFGNHAMGGVVNMITEPNYNHLAKISMEGGTYNSFNLGLNISKKIGSQGLFLNLRRKKTDGHIDKTGFESTQLNAGWTMQLTPAFNLSIQARYMPYSFDDPARGNSDPADLGTYGKIERGTGEIILKNSFIKLLGSTQVYTNFGHHRFYDGFESNDFSYGLSLYQQWLAGKFYSFAFGADVMQFGGKAKNPFAFMPNGQPTVNDDKHDITSTGAYVLGFYNPFTPLNLKAGVRYQNNSISITNIAPVAGISYSILPMLQVYANYQTGFRNPTPMELYLFPSANDQLDPEKVQSYEGGAVFQWGMLKSLKLAYFQNTVENLIQTIANPVPPPPVKFANSGKADQWGLESQAQIQFNRVMGLHLTYSYLYPDILTAYNPKNQFKYALYAFTKNYRLSVYGKFVNDLYASNYSADKLKDYSTLNTSVTIVNDNYDVFFRVLNMLNTKYEVLPGYPAPGTNARIGIDFKLL